MRFNPHPGPQADFFATNAIAGEQMKPEYAQRRGVSVRPALIDIPRAAAADPSTSHAAAARIKASGALGRQQRRVLDAVKRWPGSTSAELAEKIASLEQKHWAEVRALVARRLPELAVFHVKRGAQRVCLITKSECITWWPR